MKKKTVELAKYPEHPKGYILMYPPSEQQIWNCILENMPKNKKYLNHIVRDIWTYNSNYEEHEVNITSLPYIKIPKGDLVYYIDIYIENK